MFKGCTPVTEDISMANETSRIRDPLHNVIKFKDTGIEAVLWKVVSTEPFQRLRRIKQLGFSDLVYPGATHTRFMHSLGAYHIAKRLLNQIENKMPCNEFDIYKRDTALAAALLHDIGHGPFSHAFENAAKKAEMHEITDHEKISAEIIMNTKISGILNGYSQDSGFAEKVADLLKSESGDIYSAVVSSQFDADRLDYMQRDRLFTGTQLGMVDFEWLFSNFEIGEETPAVEDQDIPGVTAMTLAINEKAILAAESYVLNLFHLYPTVYYHKTTRGAEKLFTELICELFNTVKNGGSNIEAKTGLEKNHPVIRLIIDGKDLVERSIALDDTVMWSAFSSMRSAKNKLMADFADRLLSRRLFKCIDVRELLKARTVNERDHDKARLCEKTRESLLRLEDSITKTCKSIEEKVEEWNKDKRTSPEMMILSDLGDREAYDAYSKKGVSGRIRVKKGESIYGLHEVSEVVGNIPVYMFFRCYVSDKNGKSAEFLHKLVDSFGDKLAREVEQDEVGG